jgi:hypothetical protein
MVFQPATIEHLGFKLYSNLPPVIGELVSNAWDADAKKVEISLPEGEITANSEVIVIDDGNGMSEDDVKEAYLNIGRNRREVMKKEESNGGRPLMGRKGLGKLSAFGIADEVELRTVKDGRATCIIMKYQEMKNTNGGQPYHPTFVPQRSGSTKGKNGTEIRIKKLRRTKAISVDQLKKALARRFMVIGDKFEVLINDSKISAADRRLRSGCKEVWEAKDLPESGVIDQHTGWKVTGWIGLVPKSSQTDRGVDIFARGKAAELDTMFNYSSTHVQFARAYIVGELNAEFLDSTNDNISTARNSIQWESEEGQKLEEWGKKALAFIFNEWLKIQTKEKHDELVKTGDFEKWLQTRTPRERKVAEKLIKIIISDKEIEPESARPLLDIIKSNVEFQAFQELVDEIEEDGSGIENLLKLIDEWRVLEARESLKISDGRLEVMEKLDQYMREDALEVQKVQPLFEENGWLINPSWINVNGQNTYTKTLRDNCVEPRGTPEEDKRMDILGYDASGTLTIVELKRPGKTLSEKDLEQIANYVDWARANLMSTGTNGITYIRGIIVVGKIGSSSEMAEKRRRLEGSDIRVETFQDLLNRANRIYGEIETRLKDVAPEYSRIKRKDRGREKS